MTAGTTIAAPINLRPLTGLPVVVLFIAPLTASFLAVLPLLADGAAFRALLAHPQLPGAIALSLSTGLAGTALALAAALAMMRRFDQRLSANAALWLAVPHVAFAIGLAFLVMPTGLLSRLIATLVTGWQAPPLWVTNQDPWGLSLTAALVLKETPFLVWAFAALLSREDFRQQLAGQMLVARSLGHHDRAAWWRIVLPQVLERSALPLAAVLVYGLTVVDMAMVIGPGQPPTLAVLAWTDFNDGEAAHNARGAAGAILLAALAAGAVGLLVAAILALRPLHWLATRQARRHVARYRLIRLPSLRVIWNILFVAVLLVLVLQSVGGIWPYPNLLPAPATAAAWQQIASAPQSLMASLGLALACASLALAMMIAWFESMPSSHDKILRTAALSVLMVPQLLLVTGQYRLLLELDLASSVAGLMLVHLAPVAAYMFLFLEAAYRGFDPRWAAASAGLGRGGLTFLLSVKWPLLKSVLLPGWAVGFAVSMAQYLPAQVAAGGRYSTLPMEAVTLASGGNRAVAAAFALILAVLPLLAFLMAARLSASRWARHDA